MPGKARRVASRQAQLGRKKRRLLKETSELDMPVAAPAAPAVVDGNQDGADISAAVETPEAVTDPTPVSVPVPAPAPAPVRARPERLSPVAARNAAATGITERPGRGRREAPASHTYVGAEMRRILTLSTAVLAIIIVLGVVL